MKKCSDVTGIKNIILVVFHSQLYNCAMYNFSKDICKGKYIRLLCGLT